MSKVNLFSEKSPIFIRQ